MPMNDTAKTERARSYAWEDPMVSAGSIASMSGLDFMRAIREGRLPRPPIMATLTMDIDAVEEGRVAFAVEPQEFHYNPIGMVHGGIAATLIDSATGCAVHTTCKQGEGYTTINLNVDFMKAMSHRTGRVRCEGEVVRRGARVAIADARIVDEAGTVYARGSATCLIFPLKAE